MDLTPTGIEQAKAAGRLLKAQGYEFDLAYTSVLRRAIHTLWHTLDAMEREWAADNELPQPLRAKDTVDSVQSYVLSATFFPRSGGEGTISWGFRYS